LLLLQLLLLLLLPTDLLAIAVAVVSFLAKDKRGQTIQLLLHNLQLFVGR